MWASAGTHYGRGEGNLQTRTVRPFADTVENIKLIIEFYRTSDFGIAAATIESSRLISSLFCLCFFLLEKVSCCLFIYFVLFGPLFEVLINASLDPFHYGRYKTYSLESLCFFFYFIIFYLCSLVAMLSELKLNGKRKKKEK